MVTERTRDEMILCRISSLFKELEKEVGMLQPESFEKDGNSFPARNLIQVVKIGNDSASELMRLHAMKPDEQKEYITVETEDGLAVGKVVDTECGKKVRIQDILWASSCMHRCGDGTVVYGGVYGVEVDK